MAAVGGCQVTKNALPTISLKLCWILIIFRLPLKHKKSEGEQDEANVVEEDGPETHRAAPITVVGDGKLDVRVVAVTAMADGGGGGGAQTRTTVLLKRVSEDGGKEEEEEEEEAEQQELELRPLNGSAQ